MGTLIIFWLIVSFLCTWLVLTVAVQRAQKKSIDYHERVLRANVRALQLMAKIDKNQQDTIEQHALILRKLCDACATKVIELKKEEQILQ